MALRTYKFRADAATSHYCRSSRRCHISSVRTMAYAFADLQMLRDADGEYVIKEFSVFDSCWDIMRATVIFAPPYADVILSPAQRRHNTYVSTHIHGLQWDIGTVPYASCHATIRAITEDYTYIYVKGDEKKKLLQKIDPDTIIIDIATLGCPRLDSMIKMFVPYHGFEHSVVSFQNCAALNAKRIGYWYEFNTH